VFDPMLVRCCSRCLGFLNGGACPAAVLLCVCNLLHRGSEAVSVLQEASGLQSCPGRRAQTYIASAPRFTKRVACKVRQHFTLILVCAIRQKEVASVPGEAEASARSGRAAAGGGSSSAGLSAACGHGATLMWAGMLSGEWGMLGDFAATVLSASSCYSLSQPKLLRVCTTHVPSQPPSSLQSAPSSGCPQGCSQTPTPSVCPNREAKAPGRRRQWPSNCPCTPSSGNSSTSAGSTTIRGGQQQDMSTQRPTSKEVLGLVVDESIDPSSPCAAALQIPGGCPLAFPMGILFPKSPFSRSFWEIVQRREEESKSWFL